MVKIIDCHVHPWGNIERILDSAKRNGISKICLSSPGNGRLKAYPSSRDVSLSNDLILSILDKYPQETYGLCYLNPCHTKSSLKEIERCIIKGKMIGIKLWIACLASEAKISSIAELAQNLGIPILQHAWNKSQGNLKHESTPEDIVKLAIRFPKLKIIMAHLTGCGAEGLKVIMPYSNIYVDTAGGDPETILLEKAVSELGAQRILFGSDAPGRSFASQLGRIMGSAITKREKNFILTENFLRLFKLNNLSL